MSNNQLKYIIFTCLFAVPFVPLIVASSLFFPFITGKAFIFRLLVEIAFAAYLILMLRDATYRPKYSWLTISFFAFLMVVGLADIFAQNPLKAFWSNFERMEGYITLLHLAAYFLVSSAVLRTREVWNRLFATSVFGSAIMATYSFLQLAHKITINQGGVRVDGTLGNASYLGIYMVFHIFFAALLVFRTNSRFQKTWLTVVAIADAVILYHTATRGAILGLLGGVFVSFVFLLIKSNKGDHIRKLAGIGFVSVLLLIGIFVTFKNTTVIQKSPVLSRFATLSFSEVKTQGRYFVWPMAIKGFLERPILGWGQEGFNFVFNKYYDPRMFNQEPWFDRAHNTYLDWLIASGALGLITYLAIIVSLIVGVFRAKDEFLDKKDKAILLGAIAAYLFHNLFVFDQISSYILFFTLLAYAQSGIQSKQSLFWEKVSLKISGLAQKENLQPIFESVIVIIFVLIVYFVNFIPWTENKNILHVLFLNNQGKVGALTEYTKPLKSYGMWFSESLEHISQTSIALASNSQASPELNRQLFEVIDQSFAKHINKVPEDVRYRLFYGIYLSRFGFYDRAVEQLEKSVALSPKKQQIYFELINNLLASLKTNEAVDMARKAYELDTNYEEAGYVYGLTLLSAGRQTEANQVFAKIPESKIIFDDRYITLLASLKRFNEVIAVAKRRIALDPSNRQHYITLTAAYLQADRRFEAVQTLEELIRLEPSFKEKGDYYIKEIQAGRNP